jgi:uncharacterized protein (DUF1810 family)
MLLHATPDLSRFLFAQEDVYDTALSEIRRGRKETHWMWFIFPQLAGLGHSAMARRYAIRDIEEARAYLEHPVLGPRLVDCCQALISLNGKTASQIFGDPDDLKLRSSMTLFALAEGPGSLFEEVLTKYFSGGRDRLTLDLLGLALQVVMTE